MIRELFVTLFWALMWALGVVTVLVFIARAVLP